MQPPPLHPLAPTTRRGFLRQTGALAGTALLGAIELERAVHAAGAGTIKIGLIGCGGRGTAAALNALNAGPEVRLVALADLFADKARAALETIRNRKAAQVTAKPDDCHIGFEAYQQLLDSGVDAVLIAPASHFIPAHLQAAVEAGKHVFCEKPHGIDIPGVKICEAAAEEAARKQLSLVSGLCWRYDPGLREAMKRVQDGAIGEVLAAQSTYLSAPYFALERQPGWSELEFQFRNWYHFNWLSGDQTAQQLIHSLDKASWALGDRPPARVWGLGGRQTCLEPRFGDQFDHQAVVLEYADGARVYGHTRDQEDCHRETSDYVIGSKGRFSFDTGKYRLSITGAKNWTYAAPNPRPSMYDVEHQTLFDSIRRGRPINNGSYMCLSTKLAIAAQIAIYSGQAVAWEQVEQSARSFALDRYDWEVEPPVKPEPDGRYPAPRQGRAELEKWLIQREAADPQN